ncbi:hypothetical protein LCGC14_1433760, partial [marine sediment metagenome]
RRLISSYFSVVISISLVLFLLGLLGLLVLNTKKVADHFKEQIALNIYLKDSAKDSEITALKDTIAAAAVDFANDEFDMDPNFFQDDDTITIASSGTLPAPLVVDTIYFVVNRTFALIQLAATEGGAAINITNAGTGNHTFTKHTILQDFSAAGNDIVSLQNDPTFVTGLSPTSHPHELYSNDVDQQGLSVALTFAGGAQVRTSAVNADELSVDWTFPSGLVRIEDDGTKVDFSVDIRIEYTPTGMGAWQQAPGSPVTTTEKLTSAVRRSLRWRVANGQYDVRLTRLSEDDTSTQIASVSTWTALRTISRVNPILLPGLATTAFRIKATDQLSGAVDNFNGIVQGIHYDLVATNYWELAETSNPAALFREVAQGIANANPIPNSELDVAALELWHPYNVTESWTFNLVVDFNSTVKGLLDQIASAGRATRTMVNELWSVAFDDIKTIPVQHFTPRNSWGFNAQKIFIDLPHAFRIRFLNEDNDWAPDERIVYDNGFSINNASKFETLELQGITSIENIWKVGRYHIASVRLRPERYSFNVDIESIICVKGDLIRLAHDVPQFGLASGRIVTVNDNGTHATDIDVDENCIMEGGKTYTVRFRFQDGSSSLNPVDLSVGDNSNLVFTTPILLANAPSVGDLFMFGEVGLESVEVLVASIERSEDFVAKITCVDYSPELFNVGALPLTFAPGDVDTGAETIEFTSNTREYWTDDIIQFSTTGTLPAPLLVATDYFVVNSSAPPSGGTWTIQIATAEGGTPINLTSQGSGTHTAARQIPPFNSQISVVAPLPVPDIFSIRSDSEVIVRQLDGSFASRILVKINRPSITQKQPEWIEWQVRLNGSSAPYTTGRVLEVQDEVPILGVEEGLTYDFRLRYIATDGTLGDFTSLQTHLVIGKSDPPNDVTGFSAQQNGFTVTFRWNQVPDKDLDGYEIRFQDQSVPQDWSSAVPVTRTTRGTLITNAAIPPGTWRLLIKAFDTSKLESVNETVFLITVTNDREVVINQPQNPRWPGTILIDSGSGLPSLVHHHVSQHLLPNDTVSAAGNNFDVFDIFNQTPVPLGTYEAPEIDIGADTEARVFATLSVEANPIEVSPTLQVVAQLDYRLDAGAYDGFEPWTVGVISARFLKMRAEIDTSLGVAELVSFAPIVDVEERQVAGSAVISASGATTINFTTPFLVQVFLSVTAEAGGGGAARFATYESLTLSSFGVRIFDEGGVQVLGNVNWLAIGF